MQRTVVHVVSINAQLTGLEDFTVDMKVRNVYIPCVQLSFLPSTALLLSQVYTQTQHTHPSFSNSCLLIFIMLINGAEQGT